MPDFHNNSRQLFYLERLDPVDRLLVKSIRVDLATGANLADLKEACLTFDDWPSLVSRAAYQGVIGWVHEALLMAGKDLVPPETMEKLRSARISLTVQSGSVTANLAEMLGALDGDGIGHILLKGPYLSEHVYSRPDLRYHTDIDLLIREADVDKANTTLIEIGYKPVLEKNDSGFFDRGKTQAHYYRERCLPLDLHWELVNLPSHLSALNLDMDEIWQAAVPVQVAGVDTRALSAEDTLLFQCIHMTAHHDFNRLLWFKDVEQVIRRFGKDLDWDLFVEKCDGYGLKTCVYYSLLMTVDAHGQLDMPGWVLERLRPTYLTARLFERLAGKTNILQMQANTRRPAIEVWEVLRDGGTKRWKAMASKIFPEVRWYLECYPFLPRIKREYLYYGIYPALMVLRALKQPIGLNLSGTPKSR